MIWNSIDAFGNDCYIPILDPSFKEPWFSKSSKRVWVEHGYGDTPSFELLKLIDSMIETWENPADVWRFIHGFDEKQLIFIANNFVEMNFDLKNKYFEFFKKTKTFPNQKEIALKYIEINDLDKAIELCKKESFDLSLLDFLEGKITEEKLLNWGVGQVMKQYPKRFAPAEVMSALKERFKL